MGILEKLEPSQIVYTLELWAPECLEFGHLGSGRLVLGQKDAWTQKIKICILPSKLQSLIMISLIAGFSFSKNESILARIWYNVSKTSH